MRSRAHRRRPLSFDALEKRFVLDGGVATLLAGGGGAFVDVEEGVCRPSTRAASSDVFFAEGEGSPWQNAVFPEDVNDDGVATARDVLAVLNFIVLGRSLSGDGGGGGEGQADSMLFVDVNGDWHVTPRDVLQILLKMQPEAEPDIDSNELFPLTANEVKKLLDRAVAASASKDAIIAVVDRNGRILGVRVEDDVVADFAGNPQGLIFAIDGAVAKARTAAFFAADTAPLTSRTVRFISQSTITQREVESNPNINSMNSPLRGPGFVAPIGLGGHFPPEVLFTPPVDLVNIEHQSRDSSLHAGGDGLRGTVDDFMLATRFNATYNPDKWLFFPESYGAASGRMPTAQSRGIATLPGGIGLFRRDIADDKTSPLRMVGGIGVFFPGPDGYATFEQGFVPKAASGVQQTELQRLNAPKVLEAEWIAYAAAGGSLSRPQGQLGDAPAMPQFILPEGRIDLVGITLEVYGPHPTQANKVGGIDRLMQVGQQVGRGMKTDAAKMPVNPANDLHIPGQVVADEWIVGPRDSTDGGLTAAQVEQMIYAGIEEAELVRAAIRLASDGKNSADLNKLGARTKMVFAVADTHGEVLGLYRMPDATVFSIDVAVAKARNTAYYADPNALQAVDMIFEGGGLDPVVPAGVAFTNRTFRYLTDARFPTGAENTLPGPFSMLNDPGINRFNAENAGPALPASVYSGPSASVAGYDAFRPATNFRDPNNLDHQNGVVFFPGSSPLYLGVMGAAQLVGGLGVSGDGVDQDDVVTVASQDGFEPPPEIRADLFFVRGVRLPYQKFLRNPLG